jgi:D-amino-acid oxidase
VSSLEEAAATSRVVVNCTGLGARELVGDHQMTPIRGQIVRVRNPGLERCVLDEKNPEGLTYIVPRSDDCILGGTAEEGEWDTEPNPEVATEILRRGVALEERLSGVQVLEHKVGLRPGRPTIRLEAELLSGDGLCVHNYGHGGAGVTLSWGCAALHINSSLHKYSALCTKKEQGLQSVLRYNRYIQGRLHNTAPPFTSRGWAHTYNLGSRLWR